MPLSITDGALEWQRLAVVNKHERDDRIQFEEETHTYTIDGVRKGWTSCTGFLHNFFGHFDADAVIAKMMSSSKWVESKYYGMTAEAIKKHGGAVLASSVGISFVVPLAPPEGNPNAVTIFEPAGDLTLENAKNLAGEIGAEVLFSTNLPEYRAEALLVFPHIDINS